MESDVCDPIDARYRGLVSIICTRDGDFEDYISQNANERQELLIEAIAELVRLQKSSIDGLVGEQRTYAIAFNAGVDIAISAIGRVTFDIKDEANGRKWLRQ